MKAIIYENMMYPPVKSPLRALPAQQNTLQHPLLPPVLNGISTFTLTLLSLGGSCTPCVCPFRHS